MKRQVIWILSKFVIVLLVLLSPVVWATESAHDANLTQKVQKIIREVQQIKVGMTRAELLKVFTTEGGLSNRKHRRYVHKSCPNIKVDVEFDPVGDEKDLLQEILADKIAKISEPFLELSISD